MNNKINSETQQSLLLANSLGNNPKKKNRNLILFVGIGCLALSLAGLAYQLRNVFDNAAPEKKDTVQPPTQAIAEIPKPAPTVQKSIQRTEPSPPIPSFSVR